jgi:N-acetylmuramoyl-L-alanine amidase
MLKIAIDAGHGLMTSGKRCMKSIDRNETREWTLNNRIACALQEILAGYDCAILRVDDVTGAIDIPLSKRTKSANDWGADVYISIHHNAGVDGRSGGGTVVFYYSSNEIRKTQAYDMYNCIVNKTGLIGDRSSKVIKKGYAVLKNSKMPAFLIENGFMDSTHDVPIILTKKHAINTANGITKFLTIAFGLKKRKSASTTVVQNTATPDEFKVKVIVDSLNIRKNPTVLSGKTGCINGGGTYTIVRTQGNWGFLKSGIGWINISEKYCKRL